VRSILAVLAALRPEYPSVLLSLCCLATATGAGAQTETEAARIREARAESNRAIARHDIPGIRGFLADEYQASISNGTFIHSPAEMARSFADHFAEFRDAAYVRTPDSVAVNPAGTIAAETGAWVGSWTTDQGPFRIGGRYAASWRKVAGKWLIHSELFVPLFCEGRACRG
jgi:ketosteroid isomerase-like protein